MPTIVKGQHVFMADPQTLDLRNVSFVARRCSINLDDFGFGHVDLAFSDLPECPQDFFEEDIVLPTIPIGRGEYVDAEGEHAFNLSRFKTSCLSLFAQLAEDQFEGYARRWCSFSKYDVFRWRRGISPQVDY